jgi:hypothetical protein
VVSNSVLALLPTEANLPLTEKRRAALPATKGVAMDVPDSRPKEPCVVGNVERMFPPGAATAGLK